MRRRLRPRLIGSAVGLVLLSGSLALAAEKLQVDLLPLVSRMRSDAPMPAEVLIRWDGTRLLEGRLEMDFLAGNQLLGRYRSPELAVAAGAQRFRWLLPPVVSGYQTELDVRMRFVTKGESFNLGITTWFVPPQNEQVFVIAVCDPLGAGNSAAVGLLQSLRLEQLFTAPDNPYERSLTTVTARLTPEDMPGQPLALCAYDMVVMMNDALGQLRERQLDALQQWLRAGGSLCVLATGEGTQSAPEQWVQRLVDSDEAISKKEIAQFHAGLGRCVVTHQPDPMVLSGWREAVAFLWKKRVSQVTELPQSKRPLPAGTARSYRPGYDQYGNPQHLMLDFGQLLLPQTVRLIPFSSLAVMFGLFVLVIGPIDYFVLGWLKRRRYTWVLFPVVTVAFTVATVQMANHYLGRRDQRRSVVFVDVGTGNTVLRTARFELLFTGRDREVKTNVKGALWSRLPRPDEAYNPNYYRGQRVGDDDGSAALIEGQFPTAFTVNQSVRQWQPQMNRSLALGEAGVSVMGNWDAVGPDSLRNFAQLEAQIFGSAAGGVDFYVLGQGRILHQQKARFFPFNESHVQSTSQHTQAGLFAGLARLSPSGGATYDDLPVLDASDPREYLLVAVTQQGDDYVVYRRIYHERD